jgi:hypothetical protein
MIKLPAARFGHSNYTAFVCLGNKTGYGRLLLTKLNNKWLITAIRVCMRIVPSQSYELPTTKKIDGHSAAIAHGPIDRDASKPSRFGFGDCRAYY